MKECEKYYYKDGTEVKENDIIFYSEHNPSDIENFRYADSIQLILDVKGVLMPRTYIGTSHAPYRYIDSLDEVSNIVPLRFGADDRNVLTDATKIGEWPRDIHILTVEYAQANFPHETQRLG